MPFRMSPRHACTRQNGKNGNDGERCYLYDLLQVGEVLSAKVLISK